MAQKTNVRSHQAFKRYGDKWNSDYFEEYLLKIYKERDRIGLTDNLGAIQTVVVEVDQEMARNYICELLIMTPYKYARSFEDKEFRYHVMRISDANPDFLIREPLLAPHDRIWAMNQLSANGMKKPYTRYIGEVLSVKKLDDAVKTLLEREVRFLQPLPEKRTHNYIHWTQPSVFTWNHIGYTQHKAGQPGYDQERDWKFGAEDLAVFAKMKELQKSLKILDYVLPIDHLATRVYCHDREHAILEYLTMSAYYFWGAYDIDEQNSSTNITRNVHNFPESRTPAKVFTANNTPYYVNHLVKLPSPTEDFVRNFGRRMHHIAYAVVDGLYGKVEDDYQNVDFVVDQLKKAEKEFLLHVIGSCKEGLKQIFSKASKYSYLITEYIQRCDEYEGFFTKENVAALTLAAGADVMVDA